MKKFVTSWKTKLDIIINGIDTPAGRAFDIALIFSIILSSLLIILDSVDSIHRLYGEYINIIQLTFIVLFTIEYILRLAIADRKEDYVFSFYGIIDFFAIVPVYLGGFFSLSSFFPVIRILRLFRLFNIFAMGRYINASGTLLKALRESKVKIFVFLVTILFIVVIVGSLMYAVEGPEHGFVSIPESMYWTVVTIATVGYGDISPQTHIGKLITSLLILVGYGIIAVPTGIITSHVYKTSRDEKKPSSGKVCELCGCEQHNGKARYCFHCGYKL